MKTFTFIHKEDEATLTIKAGDFNEAEIILDFIVKNSYKWKILNEEGEWRLKWNEHGFGELQLYY